MTILVSDTSNTYKARLITSKGKTYFTATCTSGALHAAQAVVRKAYGEACSATVYRLTDPDEIKKRGINEYMANPRRKQVFSIFAFNLNPPKS